MNWLAIILKVAIFALNLILSIIIDTGKQALKLHETAVNWLKEIEDEGH